MATRRDVQPRDSAHTGLPSHIGQRAGRWRLTMPQPHRSQQRSSFGAIGAIAALTPVAMPPSRGVRPRPAPDRSRACRTAAARGRLRACSATRGLNCEAQSAATAATQPQAASTPSRRGMLRSRTAMSRHRSRASATASAPYSASITEATPAVARSSVENIVRTRMSSSATSTRARGRSVGWSIWTPHHGSSQWVTASLPPAGQYGHGVHAPISVAAGNEMGSCPDRGLAPPRRRWSQQRGET
jgi:hypothetical protein